MIKKLLLASILLLSACTTHEGLFGVMSSRPMSLYNLTIPNETVATGVSAQVEQTQIMLIPVGSTPKIDNTIEELVQKYQGDYMTNIEVFYHTSRFLPFYSQDRWEIKGDVVRVLK